MDVSSDYSKLEEWRSFGTSWMRDWGNLEERRDHFLPEKWMEREREDGGDDEEGGNCGVAGTMKMEIV